MKPLTEEDLLDATKQLIAIPSTAHDVAALHQALDCIAAMIWEAAPDVTIERFESEGKPSLLAYRGAGRPAKFHIILNGHVDVVPGKPEQYEATIKDGKLYGRGVYDMKAASVILTDVFCEFVNKVPYALGLQIVTDEESSGQNGTLYQIQQGVRAHFVICGECGRATNTHEIANEAKGSAFASLTFEGNSSHGAYPWKGDNAALKASRFVHQLHERYPTPIEATGETTITVTSVSAPSDAHNKTCDSAIVKIDARYVAGDPNFRSRSHFAALLEEIDSNYTLEIHHFSPPLYTNPQNTLLLQLKTAAEKVEGAEFSLVRRNGSSDGRFYGDIGNEACEFGIAGEDSHGDNEYIPLAAFSHYRATMRDFLEKTIVSERGTDS